MNLIKSFAKELTPDIRANCIAVGAIPTDMLRETAGLHGGGTRALGERLPLRRNGTPEDIGACAVYLASEAAWVTGQTIIVSGGADEVDGAKFGLVWPGLGSRWSKGQCTSQGPGSLSSIGTSATQWTADAAKNALSASLGGRSNPDLKSELMRYIRQYNKTPRVVKGASR